MQSRISPDIRPFSQTWESVFVSSLDLVELLFNYQALSSCACDPLYFKCLVVPLITAESPMLLTKIQDCIEGDRVLYTRHAKDEMELEELGEIREEEVSEALAQGRIIENYPEDEPYPSCLIFG